MEHSLEAKFRNALAACDRVAAASETPIIEPRPNVTFGSATYASPATGPLVHNAQQGLLIKKQGFPWLPLLGLLLCAVGVGAYFWRMRMPPPPVAPEIDWELLRAIKGKGKGKGAEIAATKQYIGDGHGKGKGYAFETPPITRKPVAVPSKRPTTMMRPAQREEPRKPDEQPSFFAKAEAESDEESVEESDEEKELSEEETDPNFTTLT